MIAAIVSVVLNAAVELIGAGAAPPKEYSNLRPEQAEMLTDHVLRTADRTFALRARVTEVVHPLDDGQIERMARFWNPLPEGADADPERLTSHEDRIRMSINMFKKRPVGEVTRVIEARSNDGVVRIDTWDMRSPEPAAATGNPSRSSIFVNRRNDIATTHIDFDARTVFVRDRIAESWFPSWLALGPVSSSMVFHLRGAVSSADEKLYFYVEEKHRAKLAELLLGAEYRDRDWAVRSESDRGRTTVHFVAARTDAPVLDIVFNDETLASFVGSSSYGTPWRDPYVETTVEVIEGAEVPMMYTVRQFTPAGDPDRTWRTRIESIDMNAEPSVEELRRVPEGFETTIETAESLMRSGKKAAEERQKPSSSE